MDNIEWCLRELRTYAAQNPGIPLVVIADTLSRHEAEQAVLLSEMTASREGYRADAHEAVELATKNRVRAEKAEARVEELESALRGCTAFKKEAEAERDALRRQLPAAGMEATYAHIRTLTNAATASADRATVLEAHIAKISELALALAKECSAALTKVEA